MPTDHVPLAALSTAVPAPAPSSPNSIAHLVCDRWAAVAPDRPALLAPGTDGRLTAVSYGALRTASLRLAGALSRRGIATGDRIAILLPQRTETVVAHLAAYRLGAIAVPLALRFGPDALAYRLADSGAKAVLTCAEGLAALRLVDRPLPALDLIVSSEGADRDALGWSSLLEEAAPDGLGTACGPDDPALMIYTSGTTGQPKGALHGHRVLLGHLPGFRFTHDDLPEPGARAWTPADWAWAGGLLNLLLPALHFGLPVVIQPPGPFDPEAAFALLRDARIGHAFIPPTALRMMRGAEPRAISMPALRTVGSAGEALGAETFLWARERFGFAVNEFYGQTECNYVIGSSARRGIGRPGWTGKPIAGHDVRIVHADGTLCEPGEMGEIAVAAPDPVMFLGYWMRPEATADKFRGPLMTTGDQAVADEEGFIRFVGRDDDVITSAGYRIGPGEIEDCLIKHPAVALAAVVGVPDPLRTEIVKAFVQLRDGCTPSDALAADIQSFVRGRLSAHEYPRRVAFVSELPMTATGKVIRRLLRDQG